MFIQLKKFGVLNGQRCKWRVRVIPCKTNIMLVHDIEFQFLYSTLGAISDLFTVPIVYYIVTGSHFPRYTSTYWNNQVQPYQDSDYQYRCYLNDGYNDSFFKNMNSHTPHMGVWITCFVAFLKNDSDVKSFLDLWYLQTLQFTTQDQIGFPYVVQKTRMIPHTLPNTEIYGDCPHDRTMFYIRHQHGC